MVGTGTSTASAPNYSRWPVLSEIDGYTIRKAPNEGAAEDLGQTVAKSLTDPFLSINGAMLLLRLELPSH